MRAHDRFVTALAKQVNDSLHSEGIIYLSRDRIDAIATTQATPENVARAALRELDDQGLLLKQEGGWSYSDRVGLALQYEQTADRQLFRERNQLRRDVLRVAGEAFDRGDGEWLTYHEGAEQFVDAPWAETFAAAQVLAYLDLLEVQSFMGHNFLRRITSAGYGLLQREDELAHTFPVDAAEDEEAHTAVAPDALAQLITSVEHLLQGRRWEGAAREVARGDQQYDAGHWTDAVREYYAAIESGLKHRLDEANAAYRRTAALRDLAKLAVQQRLIPPNYQELFSFANSIRSPRSHGAGGRTVEAEIGPAEALLMGNHARALLLYRGHRPH